jgi:ABC-type sugar transport system permease subunit
MIIFLAAVIDVPRQLYESADLDGAGHCNECAGDAPRSVR